LEYSKLDYSRRFGEFTFLRSDDVTNGAHKDPAKQPQASKNKQNQTAEKSKNHEKKDPKKKDG